MLSSSRSGASNNPQIHGTHVPDGGAVHSIKSGAWQKVFEALAADADNEYAMIDSTIVRAHQHSAGAQKKRAKIKQ